ncbi:MULTISPECIES: hypothetical protein [Streptomyces]|uniref:hypothetical protein n=1 Tax=Streptomyces TaxID=1883 RepID=UPI00163BF326|nr:MULTISPECIES: hypothetical protein [Streptomyces]MBC2876409.1 hypothetical protein [Streptomyces sp. TYQ1024]UBI35377.1 hypothetical protein K7I03_02135 [Streptomyces mobaraensis]UKW27968.1 hypothetical protein MCU78_02165 [Streptomyces sp. TYQ1024]
MTLTFHSPQGLYELLYAWGVLQRQARPQRCVAYLVRHTDLALHDLEHLRLVRNRCAHPEDGWPAQVEMDRALSTARRARRCLGLDG